MPTVRRPDSAVARTLRGPASDLVGDGDGPRTAYTAQSVHALRVAARRLRAGLRLFADEYPARRARAWGAQLRHVLEVLGPARDADVWLARLGDRRAVGPPAFHPDWPLILAAEEQRLARVHADAREFLAGRRWIALRRSLRTLAAAVPARGRVAPRLAPAAIRRLRRLLRQLARTKHPLKDSSSLRAHAFRRRCRRARYWAEFAAPFLGPRAGRLGRDLRRLADQLGDERDARLALRRLARRRTWWAEDVRRRSRRQATEAARAFARRWRRFRRDWDARARRKLLSD